MQDFIVYNTSTSNWEIEVSNRFTSDLQVSAQLKKLLASLHQNTDLYQRNDFDVFHLKEIYAYLKASHIYYLQCWLPKINQTSFQLSNIFGKDFLAVNVLTLFLEKYQRELESHIRFEEQVLFDFTADLFHGSYSTSRKNFVINHFLVTHNDNVIVHLADLKNDLTKIEPGLSQNLVFQILFNQLEIFQNDLLVHGLIEDEVFVPKLLTYIHENFEPVQRV